MGRAGKSRARARAGPGREKSLRATGPSPSLQLNDLLLLYNRLVAFTPVVLPHPHGVHDDQVELLVGPDVARQEAARAAAAHPGGTLLGARGQGASLHGKVHYTLYNFAHRWASKSRIWGFRGGVQYIRLQRMLYFTK